MPKAARSRCRSCTRAATAISRSCVGAARLKSPISPFTPRALTAARRRAHRSRDFVRCAQLAREAGYDGVEIMGSEGYLINQFLVPAHQQRTDEWGGASRTACARGRDRAAGARGRAAPDFIVMYRLSMIDLVEGGSTWDEVVQLAQGVEAAGATILNTGIGWHEARVPTIVTSVPRAAFGWVTGDARGTARRGVTIPLVARNRINTPEVAEEPAAPDGDAGRPGLAWRGRSSPTPAFVAKAASGRADEINTCIACNQACLDHTFSNKRATCLVNPRAGCETELVIAPAVGARKRDRRRRRGPGRACLRRRTPPSAAIAVDAVRRRRNASAASSTWPSAIRARRSSARRCAISRAASAAAGVELRLGTRVDARAARRGRLRRSGRSPPASRRATRAFPGIEQPEGADATSTCCAWQAGGRARRDRSARAASASTSASSCCIDRGEPLPLDRAMRGCDEWGVDRSGARARRPEAARSPRSRRAHDLLLQRKAGKLGAGLGKTSGWVHRATLARNGVEMLGGVSYLEISERGLKIAREGVEQWLKVETIVICAGQESLRDLQPATAASDRGGWSAVSRDRRCEGRNRT